MRELLDNALESIKRSIANYEYRIDIVKRLERDSWLPWRRWVANIKLSYLHDTVRLLYLQKVRILELMDKYETDPLS